MTEYREITIATTITKMKKSVLVRLEDGTDKWIPWKVIEENGETFKIDGEPMTIYVAEWFAEREGIE